MLPLLIVGCAKEEESVKTALATSNGTSYTVVSGFFTSYFEISTMSSSLFTQLGAQYDSATFVSTTCTLTNS